mmetsp:Transcript_22723/g.26916  ORF Transcript_22723/g.26916 Transcript_22723/m.26916 type:complete len:80 (-) Transcript_22723:18-257(-)
MLRCKRVRLDQYKIIGLLSMSTVWGRGWGYQFKLRRGKSYTVRLNVIFFSKLTLFFGSLYECVTPRFGHTPYSYAITNR